MHRGKVSQITLHIKYPDGTTKITHLTNKAGDISAIYFDEFKITADNKGKWDVSQDNWRENPTVLVEYSNGDVLAHCSVMSGCVPDPEPDPKPEEFEDT